MSPIRPSVCPQDIYETNETSNYTSSQIWHTPNNLLGRHFVHEPNSYRDSAGHVNSNSFIRKPRFCNKLNKISTEANPDFRISGVYSGYQEYDTSSSPREGDRNQRPVLSDAVLNGTACSRYSTINREANSLNSGYIPSPTTLSPVTELKKHSPSVRGELQHESQPQSCMSRGTAVVDSPPECLEQPSHTNSPTRSSDRHKCITTGLGGGAVCKEVRTGGLWSQNERLLHINCLELLAGAFAVKCFTKNQICLHVRLRMDNTTAIAYLNKLGGTRSLVLSNLVAELWSWALNRGMILSAEHLPGKWNTQADQESRHYQDSSDWHLDPSLFLALMKIRGPCQIDLFANRLNAQLPAFFSWKPDPQGLASDAFQQA